MKYETSELVFILDRSGSMSGLEKDTIGGFNSLIQKQRKEKGKCYVSCVLFDDVQEVIYDRVPLNEVKKMTQKQYYARGCTALLDAMGGTIHYIGNVHKYSKEEIGKTLFIIITDGLENNSKRYTHASENHEQFYALKKQVDAVDDELDKLDDEFEYAYQMKEISFEIYKARERAIEKLEDELELAEEALENKYGIDD